MERVPRDLRIPAMLVWVDDYLAGGVHLSAEAFGVLTRCLCFQWMRGSVPARDLATLGRIAGVSRARVRRIWADDLAPRFVEDRPGEFVNARCEREYARARRNATRKSGRKPAQPLETIPPDRDEFPQQIALPLESAPPYKHKQSNHRGLKNDPDEYARSGRLERVPPFPFASTEEEWSFSSNEADS